MKNKIYIVVVALALVGMSHSGKAQYYLPQNNVWAMNNNVGLKFNPTGDPEPITTSMAGITWPRACAAISDGENHLLFYSNGYKIWDSTHTPMPHGQNIAGLSHQGPIASQGALIVPMPGNTQKYYLFTLLPTGTNRITLYCNLVDMSLHGGLGDVDTTFSLYGVPLADSLSHKMTAARGCNQNTWVIVHKNIGDVFLVLEVTPSGINTNPVTCTFPSTANGYQLGVFKMNTAGDRLLVCEPGGLWGGLFLYDFNPYTGIISNPVPIDTSVGYYGGTFSPDGTKLYGRSYTYQSCVYQFDLNAPVPFSTRLQLGTVAPPNLQAADMKLGPDGKIYVGSCIVNQLANGFQHMSRINNPNNAGLACNFQDTIPGIYFPAIGTGDLLYFGLPNDIVVPVPGVQQQHVVWDTVICHLPANGLQLQAPAGYQGYNWNDMSTGITKTITQGGTYWVRYRTSGCDMRTDSFRIKGTLPDLAIVFSNNMLSTTHTYPSYQWYKEGMMIQGANGPNLVPTANGWYSVKVTGAYGCTDSAAILVGASGIGQPGDLKDYIHISPNPAQDQVVIEAPIPVYISLFEITGKKLLEERQQKILNTRNIPEGLFFLRISDRDGRLLKTEKLLIRR